MHCANIFGAPEPPTGIRGGRVMSGGGRRAIAHGTLRAVGSTLRESWSIPGNVASDGTESVYRSTRWFTALRMGEAIVLGTAIAVVAASGPVWQATIGAAGAALVVLVVLARLIRSRLVISAESVTVLGTFRDRQLPTTTVIGASAKPSWYLWQRIVCPVTLFLTTSDGFEVRVSAVQSMIWNVGLARPSVQAEVARSYPQRVADELNARFGSST